MKTLHQYINETNEINELNWKIDTFFKEYPTEKESFDNLVHAFKATKNVDLNVLASLLANTVINIKQIVDFLNDRIITDPNVSVDYTYQLKKIIELLINNRQSYIYINNPINLNQTTTTTTVAPMPIINNVMI